MAGMFTAAPFRTRATAARAAFGAGLGRYRDLLRQRSIALLLGAGLLSEIGDWFNTVALIELAYQVGNGSLSVGVMLALRTVPRLLLQAPAGALVDRFPGRGLLVISHLLMSILAVAFILLIPFPSLWLLYALVVALESISTVAWPALRIQLVRETPSSQFAAVNGMLSIGLTGAQFVGPLLGGLVLVGFGAGTVFAVNGVSFLAVAIIAGAIRGSASPAHTSEAACSSITEEEAENRPGGYRALAIEPNLVLFAVAAMAVTIAVRGAVALFVVRADQLGFGEGGPGYFFAAVALGAIAGGALAGIGTHIERAALGIAALAMLACALGLAWFGVGGTIAALVALVIAGCATNVYEVAGLTFFQHHVPESLYGRFMAVFMLALGLGGIIGALGGPFLETWFSAATALGLLAIPGATFALAFLVSLTRRRRQNAH